MSPAPSVSSTRRRSGCPSAFSCSGLSRVRTSRIGLDSVAAMPLYTPVVRLLSRQTIARPLPRRRPRACGLRPSESGSRASPGPGGRPNARSTASAFSSPVTMKTTSGAEPSTGTVSVTRSTNGSSVGSAGIARRSRSSSVGWPREERRRVPVRADPEQDVVEARASRSELVVLARRLFAAELAADPLHLAWRRPRSGRAGSRARGGSSSARPRAARSARRPTRARRRSSRARARPRARRRGPGVPPPVRTSDLPERAPATSSSATTEATSSASEQSDSSTP